MTSSTSSVPSLPCTFHRRKLFRRWRRPVGIVTVAIVLAMAMNSIHCSSAPMVHAFAPSSSLWANRFQQQQPRPAHPSMKALSTPLSQQRQHTSFIVLHALSDKETASIDLERTARHLEKVRRQSTTRTTATTMVVDGDIPATAAATAAATTMDDRQQRYASYACQPANALKTLLAQRGLPQKGRKPDLAERLVRHDLLMEQQPQGNGSVDATGAGNDDTQRYATETLLGGSASKAATVATARSTDASVTAVSHFGGGVALSDTASGALTRANFRQPTPIQAAHATHLQQSTSMSGSSNSSAILHAATGSGKTLAYVLPITEALHRESSLSSSAEESSWVAWILLPTRELAAQVAGICTVLAPPGTVRLVAHPSNLAVRQTSLRDQGSDDPVPLDSSSTSSDSTSAQPRIFVGSAKAVYTSLYGDKKLPAAPTPKPLAMRLLQSTRFLVLDEVDRLLGVAAASSSSSSKGSRKGRSSSVRHEKPAAVLTAAVARLTLGRAVVTAASATVGRPLRRELARCLGLPPQEGPAVVRGTKDDGSTEDAAAAMAKDPSTTRAVTIPDSVRHFVVPVGPSGNDQGTSRPTAPLPPVSPGTILTACFTAIQSLPPNRRILLVLTRNFGISTANAVGALKHFHCQPEPVSLLDALEESSDGEGTIGIAGRMQAHRRVTGASGVGEAMDGDRDETTNNDVSGYLLVTGEDSVRGLHLDALDLVVVAGRPNGPDEYTHIAGRTGRAGAPGACVNVCSAQDARKLTSWENMLSIQYQSIDATVLGDALTIDDVRQE